MKACYAFLVLTITLMLILPCITYAEIINVPDDFETIQAGIDAAEDRDTVLVQEGRYEEEYINFRGKEIVLTSRYLLTGEQNYINSTIIEGSVGFRTWESENSILIGFSIQNGGCGIYCEYSNPTIRNCIITNNTRFGISCNHSNPVIDSCEVSENCYSPDGQGFGGGISCTRNSNPLICNSSILENNGTGIMCSESNPTIRNCTISGNSYPNGAGINCFSSSPEIINCSIINNTARLYGGGVLCQEESSPNITSCIISHNVAGGGAGINIDTDCNPTLLSCYIGENSANEGSGIRSVGVNTVIIEDCAIIGNMGGRGGGIHCLDHALFLINSCTFSRNSAEGYGGGISCEVRSNLAISNSIFWENTPHEIYLIEEGHPCLVTVSFSDIQGGRDAIVLNNNGRVAWGEGNIDNNPLFVNPDGSDFSLFENSPCIDTGNPDSPLDPDGTRADMGAYYFHQEIDYVNPGSPFNHKLLFEAYPNPFNAITNLSYSLPILSSVSIQIYDVSGRMVTTLFDGRLSSGYHSVVWDGSNTSSGIYFIRMSAGEFKSVQKVTLVK
jgi:predicted outer membrane repeat protein/parallel beta-helix repeat protein